MYKYIVIIHDLYFDNYRAFAQCNTKREINRYVYRYCHNEEEAIVIDVAAGILTEVFEKKDFEFRHLNLLSHNAFITIEQIGLTWKRCQELAKEGYR